MLTHSFLDLYLPDQNSITFQLCMLKLISHISQPCHVSIFNCFSQL